MPHHEEVNSSTRAPLGTKRTYSRRVTEYYHEYYHNDLFSDIELISFLLPLDQPKCKLLFSFSCS